MEKKNYYSEYVKRPIGRAAVLVAAYNQIDKTHGRGKGDLTAKWVAENILSKPCAHCGETDWHKIGCNRLDETKPHTKDNVEPCCKRCNDFLNNPPKQVYQYTLDGKLVKTWESTRECARNGFNKADVILCCQGKYKKHKGYRWSYTPL